MFKTYAKKLTKIYINKINSTASRFYFKEDQSLTLLFLYIYVETLIIYAFTFHAWSTIPCTTVTMLSLSIIKTCLQIELITKSVSTWTTKHQKNSRNKCNHCLSPHIRPMFRPVGNHSLDQRLPIFSYVFLILELKTIDGLAVGIMWTLQLKA